MTNLNQATALTTAKMRTHSDGRLVEIAGDIEEMLMDGNRQHVTLGISEIEGYGPLSVDLETNLVHVAPKTSKRGWIEELHTTCGETLWDIGDEMMGRLLIVTLLASREDSYSLTCAACLPKMEGREWELTWSASKGEGA